jgi:hypothetical protein
MEAAGAATQNQRSEPQQYRNGRTREQQAMNLFFDTSAFIKRYIDEPGSEEVESLCILADDIAVSIVLPVEAMSAFSRLKRAKKVSVAQYRRLKESLFEDLRDITILPIHPLTVSLSIKAIENAHLKALDAIHIGSSIDFKPDFFVSADRQQLAAAEQCGLKIKSVS